MSVSPTESNVTLAPCIPPTSYDQSSDSMTTLPCVYQAQSVFPSQGTSLLPSVPLYNQNLLYNQGSLYGQVPSYSQSLFHDQAQPYGSMGSSDLNGWGQPPLFTGMPNLAYSFQGSPGSSYSQIQAYQTLLLNEVQKKVDKCAFYSKQSQVLLEQQATKLLEHEKRLSAYRAHLNQMWQYCQSQSATIASLEHRLDVVENALELVLTSGKPSHEAAQDAASDIENFGPPDQGDTVLDSEEVPVFLCPLESKGQGDVYGEEPGFPLPLKDEGDEEVQELPVKDFETLDEQSSSPEAGGTCLLRDHKDESQPVEVSEQIPDHSCSYSESPEDYCAQNRGFSSWTSVNGMSSWTSVNGMDEAQPVVVREQMPNQDLSQSVSPDDECFQNRGFSSSTSVDGAGAQHIVDAKDLCSHHMNDRPGSQDTTTSTGPGLEWDANGLSARSSPVPV